MKKLISIVTIVSLLFAVGLVAKPLDDGQPLAKPAAASAGQVTRTLSNISNWAYWVYSNGMTAHTPSGSSGGIYPRGTAGAIYQDGFVWGGKYDANKDGVAEEIRVGGQTYNIGTQPGRVITGGRYEDDAFVLADEADMSTRVYRIRADYETLNHAMLIQDAAEQQEISSSAVTEAMTQEIMDQYALDWAEWPTAWGAPYYDLDDDGVYTAGVDKPGIAQADQVVWYVVNDYNQTKTTGLYGSKPIGVEVQTTLWAYNQPGVRLGQIIFRSNKIINKSGTTLEDVYVSMWADPDLGSASNDYAGCDTSLSLGFCYNGEATDGDFDAFDLAPPAFGYDFFQGPMIPSVGDTAISGLEYVPDHMNLPMTSYGWFAAGSAIEDPELGDYKGTLQFYNLMKGYKPTEDIDNPSPWTLGNVAGNAETKYPLSGDPVADTGDLDGHDSYFPPGDRRMCVSSGPFTFAAGESQEVVVAIIGGLGVNNLGSVTDLKQSDAVAQALFDGLFLEVPKPPAAPNVVARPFEDFVVLEWGSDTARVAETEETVVSGYEFEGYTVYQLPHATATKDQAVRLATYDIDNEYKIIYEIRNPDLYEGEEVEVPIAYGDNTGIQRYHSIEWDYIDNAPLYEGKTYYYAVTAYNQNHDDGRLAEKAQESAMIAIGITLQEPLPGDSLTSEAMDLVDVSHTAGGSDGVVRVTVIDPFALTGDDYQVTFVEDVDTNSATYGEILWNLENATEGVVLLENQEIISEIDIVDGHNIVDGFEIRVSGPAAGIKSVVEVAYAGTPVDDDNLWHSLNSNFTYYVSAGGGDGGFGRLNRYAEYQSPRDFEMRFTDGPNYGIQAFTTDVIVSVPFELWDIGVGTYDDTSDDKRMIPFIYENTARDTFGYDGDTEPVYSFPASDWVYWMDPEAGTNGYDDFASVCVASGGQGAAYDWAQDASTDGYYVDWHGGFVYPIGRWIFGDYDISGGIPSGTVIRALTTKPNTVDDVFGFTTSAPTTVDFDVDKVGVYPNPYYASNALSTTPYDQYVKFTHLPETATIKIFNLAGVMIRTIDHEASAGQFETWDLQNEAGIPVASGMYLAHIDMPDEGVTKILKVMIVQKKQILEYF